KLQIEFRKSKIRSKSSNRADAPAPDPTRIAQFLEKQTHVTSAFKKKFFAHNRFKLIDEFLAGYKLRAVQLALLLALLIGLIIGYQLGGMNMKNKIHASAHSKNSAR
ncbi:MAG: hypothetical protein ABIP97_11455, partial [Chthoniobacterales bacterium]